MIPLEESFTIHIQTDRENMKGSTKMGSPTVREFGIMKVATLTQVNSLTANQTDLDGSFHIISIHYNVRNLNCNNKLLQHTNYCNRITLQQSSERCFPRLCIPFPIFINLLKTMCFAVFSVILETTPETIVFPYVSDYFFAIPPKKHSEPVCVACVLDTQATIRKTL